ncbi:Gfo/Idh/MocA family protein [Luxibacter massiliensis]|uniref:Gfo/Idh/MocA family protein n=1 Tax=Luxibacter massiliensis TaxID=2219695 RepID=UPI000F0513D4|nr:Gfo/Idh/MocA family oxidoreductase [Luxibacter massiliensis]
MKQVTSVLIGAGLRGGHVYSQYALEHPDELKVAAVAEPDRNRREAFASKHNIPEDMQFESYEELLDKGRLADCAMICTQDRMHCEPVIAAMEKGYHVLCEKPMSPEKEEILKMGEFSHKYNRILSVCHVLRYSPFFTKVKGLLEEGRIGRLMSIQHIEEVGYWHHAHSFVRGNWRNAEESSPMILQKCCHDMDILLWLSDSHCKTISSCGSLTYFKEQNAPPKAPEYCMDGCGHRADCPFYAPRFYLEHPRAEEDGLVYAVTENPDTDSVLRALREGPYGRCVFRCDNTVVDHQSVDIEFENEVTASFLMTAFTNQCARRIRLMGTKGELKGDMEAGTIELFDFVSHSSEAIRLNTPTKGHSGSDMSMMRDFVRMVGEGKPGKTDASMSVESHLMALAAEEARVNKVTIDFKEYL